MSKPHATKGIKRKRAATVFKSEWLDEVVKTEAPDSRNAKPVRVQLSEIFTYGEENGIVCCYCRDAKATGDFTTRKVWNDVWKLDFLKRHQSSKSHTDSVTKLRSKNPTSRGGLVHMLLESPSKKENRQTSIEWKRSSPDEIKVLIDGVLLAIKMNISILSVQKINEHMAKYVSIPNSWRSKNYAFEFIEIINGMVQDNVMADISFATYQRIIASSITKFEFILLYFRPLPYFFTEMSVLSTVDESTDISVKKYLILYFKYRPVNSNEYRTSFGGMLQLEACDATSTVTAIKEFYKKHKLDLNKMIMFTSDGASVMLGKINGVAAQLRKDVPHLVQQHCVSHREDLGLCDSWKEVKLMKL